MGALLAGTPTQTEPSSFAGSWEVTSAYRSLL